MEAELVHLNRDGRIELWARRVGECKSSGLTVRKWCEQQHINEKTYFRWQKIVAETVSKQNAPRFAEIAVQAPTADSQNSVIATLHCQKMSIQICSGASPAEIEAIFRGASLC